MHTTRKRIEKRGQIRMSRKNYVSKLKDLYPVCVHDGMPSYDGHNITYGEMDYKGMQKLNAHVQQLNPDINTFMDIGSGRGKLCLYLASLKKIIKSIGIELVKSRCDDANKLKAQLANTYANKVEFICANILDVSLKDYLPINATVFIWFSNLCFNQDTINDIFEKIVDEIPAGSIICCSKQTDMQHNKLQFIESIPIEMSWQKNSTVSIYKII